MMGIRQICHGDGWLRVICILKAKSNFTLFIYIPFQDICE